MGFATFRAFCAHKAPTQHQCVTRAVAKPVAAFQRGRTDEKPFREPRNAALDGAIRTRLRERNGHFLASPRPTCRSSSAVGSRRSIPAVAAVTPTRSLFAVRDRHRSDRSPCAWISSTTSATTRRPCACIRTSIGQLLRNSIATGGGCRRAISTAGLNDCRMSVIADLPLAGRRRKRLVAAAARRPVNQWE